MAVSGDSASGPDARTRAVGDCDAQRRALHGLARSTICREVAADAAHAARAHMAPPRAEKRARRGVRPLFGSVFFAKV